MKKILLFIFLLPTLAFAQLELPFPIKLVNPKPVDFWYFESDGTPYDNTGEVISQVLSAIRYRGMTFNVNGVEYWFKDGITDGDLIAKGGSSLTLINGNGTTVNGTGDGVDWGGTLTGNVEIDGAYDVLFGNTTPLTTFTANTSTAFYLYANDGTPIVSIEGAINSGTDALLNTTVSDSNYEYTEFIQPVGVETRFVKGDITSGFSFSDTQSDFFFTDTGGSPYEKRLTFTPVGTVLALGSDATGDTYYRNSSGYFTRLAAGTNGHVLTLASGIPSWAAPSGGSGLTYSQTKAIAMKIR